MVTVRSLESVHSPRYFRFCNVLHIWTIRAIPTNRVYRLYDIIIILHLLETSAHASIVLRLFSSTLMMLNPRCCIWTNLFYANFGKFRGRLCMCARAHPIADHVTLSNS